MKVKGNIQSVQSDLDFCIKITSTGKIKTVDKLRRHFFSIFMDEERERLSDLLEEKKLRDALMVDFEGKKEDVGAEEVGYGYKEPESNETVIQWNEDLVEPEVTEQWKDAEVITEEPKVNTFLNNPFTKSFFQHKPEPIETEEDVYVGGIDLDSEVEEDISEEVTYVSSGIDLDEYTEEGIEDNEDESISSIEYIKEPEKVKDNYLLEENIEQEVEVEVDEPILGIPVGYSSHGIYLNDDGTIEGLMEDTELEDDEGDLPFTSITYVEPEEETFEEEPREVSIEEEYEAFKCSLSSNAEERERRRKRREELRAQAEAKRVNTITEEPEVTEVVETEELREPEEPEWFSNEPEIEEPITFEVTKNEEPTDAPKDIRDFLRQHPNSDIGFVAKFYPMKEIEKQIKLGRVYKKKGKLMI